jgi:gliding motility-associated-like protein
VPNVFTPTDAGIYGLDNIFYIKTTNLSSWSIVIYDRWGKEMFKSSNPNEYWNGTAEGGGQAPAGVYYYILDGVCQGTTYNKQGYVQLIR